jgi:hypothetical protein
METSTCPRKRKLDNLNESEWRSSEARSETIAHNTASGLVVCQSENRLCDRCAKIDFNVILGSRNRGLRLVAQLGQPSDLVQDPLCCFSRFLESIVPDLSAAYP